MQVALMVPCYIDMFYPRVGIATLELLHGVIQIRRSARHDVQDKICET
jgi:hypothetical protein